MQFLPAAWISFRPSKRLWLRLVATIGMGFAVGCWMFYLVLFVMVITARRALRGVFGMMFDVLETDMRFVVYGDMEIGQVPIFVQLTFDGVHVMLELA